MADVILSPNMNLPVPEVGIDPGPDWANNINACLGILDEHNHSLGQGVQITPAGININADLPMNDNNLTLVNTVNFQALASSLPGLSPNLGCIYVAGNELYYNDESGNVVAITKTGSVNAGAGSITGLPSGTASASYSSISKTFVWQSATSTPANMDGGSFIFRDIVANSDGITVSAPVGLSVNYQMFLPGNLPSSNNSFWIEDTSGNISYAAVDNATLEVTAGTLEVAPQGIQQGNLAPRSTGTTVAAGGVAVSVNSGTFSTSVSYPAFTPVTNLNVTITTTGRPVRVFMQPLGNGVTSYIQSSNGIYVDVINSTNATIYRGLINFGSGAAAPSEIDILDMSVNGVPGTYSYQINVAPNTGSASVYNSILVAYEI